MESNRSSLTNGAEIVALFPCGVQMVLEPSVLTSLDISETGEQ